MECREQQLQVREPCPASCLQEVVNIGDTEGSVTIRFNANTLGPWFFDECKRELTANLICNQTRKLSQLGSMSDTATRFAFFLVRLSTVTVPLVPRSRPPRVSAAPQPNRVLHPKPRLALNVSTIAQHAPPISSYLISFIVLWNNYPNPLLLQLVSSIS